MDWNVTAALTDAVCVSTFADATAVSYTHESEEPPVVTTYTGVFSAATERIVLEGGVPVATEVPSLGLHVADLLSWAMQFSPKGAK